MKISPKLKDPGGGLERVSYGLRLVATYQWHLRRSLVTLSAKRNTYAFCLSSDPIQKYTVFGLPPRSDVFDDDKGHDDTLRRHVTKMSFLFGSRQQQQQCDLVRVVVNYAPHHRPSELEPFPTWDTLKNVWIPAYWPTPP